MASDSLLRWLVVWLADQGLPSMWVGLIARGLMVGMVILLSVAADFLVKRFFLKSLAYVIKRTRTTWDDAILERRVLERVAHLAPALVVYWGIRLPFEGHPQWIVGVQRAAEIYIILVGMLVTDALLNAVLDIYRTFEIAREISIKWFVQVVKILVYFVGGVLIFSLLLDKNAAVLLSGLGAFTAVLLLIFKDTILGFVAGIQLNANKMVAVGDWIEMPKYGADGDVLEVALTTVKVQNWDKTITTIPTYALISESFKNWRGMQESGGRRIKRSIYLDMSTIRFCTEEMLSRFSTIQYISDYIETKKVELAQYNTDARVDESSLANGRRMTNVGTFRAYVTAYLKNHPMISQEMTFLVRQLAPAEQGLPIEIYVFCTDQVWANYEAIQADLFDHILAVVPEFDLRVFQPPTGADFQSLRA